jgi:hypothetical protein
MRPFTSACCAGLLLALSAAAQPLRIVTWQPGDFPASPAGAESNSPPTLRLGRMATVLKAYDPDVIVLEGVNDRSACQRLAGLMKPATFQFAQFAALRGTSNAPVTRPAAVLARKVAGSVRSLDWKSAGQIDSAGGFAFVPLTVGTNPVWLYLAQFVDAPAARTNLRIAEINARKRETASQYVLHHTRWIESALTNSFTTFLLLGNLGEGQALWPGDDSVHLLKQGGFQANPLSESVDPTAKPFPQLFARNARFDGAPQTPTPKDFEIGPVVYELAIQQPPAPATVVNTAEPLSSPPGRLADSPQWSLPVDERFLWLAAPVAGALVLFLLLLLPFRWLAGRRQRRAWVPPRAASNAVVVDFASEPESPAALESARAPLAELGEDGSADWPERARKAEGRAQKASASVREGLMAQLVRLMRDKIFQRLNSQRAHLIDSHVSGTMQVLELEERLEKIQSQFQARLDDRERRVAELEKELAAKEKFIAEHTKAKLRLASRASNR